MEVVAKKEISSVLEEIFRPLQGLGNVQVFVHGSWADSSRTAFSDLDDFVIVDDNLTPTERIELQRRLNDIEFHFQRIDPLQHHGHWLINKNELKNYDNSFIPLFVLQNAVSVVGPNTLHGIVNPGKTMAGLVKNIIGTCRNIERYQQRLERGCLNIYELKCFVGSILLLPPLIFQVLGSELDKRSAILNADKIISDKCLKLIEFATQCRNNWRLITESEEYRNFVKKLDGYTNGAEWRRFAASHAPVLDYSALSSVPLNGSLTAAYIKEALNYVDSVSFRRMETFQYDVAYGQIEDRAKVLGALVVGRFGNISCPSISDLDVFICFSDYDYVKGVRDITEFIKGSVELQYLVIHPPVFVSVAMLPYVHYLHTLADLKITHQTIKFSPNSNVSDEYSRFLNSVWTFYFYKYASSVKDNLSYHSTRSLTLLLKNLHTSIENVYSLLNEPSAALEKSKEVRHEVLKDGVAARSLVEKSVLEAFSELATTLRRYPIDRGLDRNFFIVNRALAVEKSKDNRVAYAFEGSTLVVNDAFFQLLYLLLISKRKKGFHAFCYMKAHIEVRKCLLNLGVQESPFITPFSLEIMIPVGLRSKFKKQCFLLLNLLPENILRIFFKQFC